MPRDSNQSRSSRNDEWGVTELVRERPLAAAAAAAGAAAAGLFLWSRRAQISNQLSNLSGQIGEWTESFSSGENDGTAGLTTSASTMTSRQRGMSKTGGGNANLGRRSGGGGAARSASGRGRVSGATPQATR